MRGYRSYGNYSSSHITPLERILSGLSYLTSGLVGFIWIIVSHIKGKSLSSFARFNIFQSIFIFISIYVLGIIFNILLGMAQMMPVIGPLTVNIAYLLKDYPLILGFSIINFAIIALCLYMAISAFLGKHAEVPWFSDNVRRMV